MDAGRCVEAVTERDTDVPRRALNTTSSGLGPLNANPTEEVADEAGGGTSCRLCFLRLGFSKTARWSLANELSLCPLSSGAADSSLISKEANAEGDARERGGSVNMGRSKVGMSASGSGFIGSCVFLLFIASLDRLGSPLLPTLGANMFTVCDDFPDERVGRARSLRVW